LAGGIYVMCELRREIKGAREDLGEITSTIGQIDGIAKESGNTGKRCEGHLSDIRREVREFREGLREKGR
jgi:hypothetical protein